MYPKPVRGIYVHIPFCRHKCDYCSFFSRVTTDTERITQMICTEISSRAEREDNKIETIYIGGGTPSVLESGEITKIIESLHQNFDLKSLKEQTIEVNPESVTSEKLKTYRDLGFNRISVGVQSLEKNLLSRIGRIHSPERALWALKRIREHGFDNLSVDLMYGLPGQRLEDLSHTLETLFKFCNPEHVSAYALTLEPGTKMYESGLKTTDQDREAEMMDFVDEFLISKGFDHYEISNYAKPGYRSRHNGFYWNMDSYFGFGPGASSFLSGVRTVNTTDFEAYLRGEYVSETIPADDRILKEEMIFTGLRRVEGVSGDEYFRLFGTHLEYDYGKELKDLIDRGLLQRSGDSFRLTKRGLEIANQVFLAFIS